MGEKRENGGKRGKRRIEKARMKETEVVKDISREGRIRKEGIKNTKTVIGEKHWREHNKNYGEMKGRKKI